MPTSKVCFKRRLYGIVYTLSSQHNNWNAEFYYHYCFNPIARFLSSIFGSKYFLLIFPFWPNAISEKWKWKWLPVSLTFYAFHVDCFIKSQTFLLFVCEPSCAPLPIIPITVSIITQPRIYFFWSLCISLLSKKPIHGNIHNILHFSDFFHTT